MIASAHILRASQTVLREYGILIALAIFVVIVQTQSSDFLTQTNLLNIGQQWAPVGVMAVGMTFVLIAGGFDLSVGAIYALSATLGAGLAVHYSDWIALAAALGLGAGVGLVNGFLITKININPFIATLGMALIIRGFAFVYSEGNNYEVDSRLFNAFGFSYIGSVPVPFIILVGFLVAGAVVLRWFVYGRKIYSIGGNDEASWLAGIRTDRVRMSTYVLSGLTASVAGCIYIGRLGGGQANIGIGIEFDVIAACLIGGISITGGLGAMWMTAAGLGFLAVLQNFFNLTNVSGYWQSIVKGGIIIGAVAIDSYGKRRHKRPLRLVLATRMRRTESRASPESSEGPGSAR